MITVVVSWRASEALRSSMKKLALLIAVALTASPLAAAQLPTPLPEIAADAARTDRYPAHNATFPNGVTSIADLQYWPPAR